MSEEYERMMELREPLLRIADAAESIRDLLSADGLAVPTADRLARLGTATQGVLSFQVSSDSNGWVAGWPVPRRSRKTRRDVQLRHASRSAVRDTC